MKRAIAVLLAVIISITLFAGCNKEAVNTQAAKPCIMVNATLYWLEGSHPVSALPAGWEYSGEIEDTAGAIPNSDFSGALVGDGALIYLNDENTVAAYIYYPSSQMYEVFVIEALQYQYVMVNDTLYISANDYNYMGAVKEEDRKNYPAAGSLSDAYILIGRVATLITDNFPSENFQTNFSPKIGYDVYVNAENGDVIYLKDPDDEPDNLLQFIKYPY